MITASVIAAPLCLAFGVYHALRSYHEREMERHPDVLRIRRRLSQIFPEIDRVRILKAGSSYTLGKEKIYMCTRDKKSNVYDDNTLTYVFLHELAHCQTKQVGHGDEFKRQFARLLYRAKQFGLYDDRIPHDSNYCGYVM